MSTDFHRIAKSLSLSDRTTATAWGKLNDLRIGPDDPEVARILLHMAMLEDAGRIATATRNAVREAQQAIDSTALNTIRSITEAAEATESASAMKLAEQQDHLVLRMVSEIAASVDRALKQKIALRSHSTFAAWVMIACLMATVACGGGYLMGQHARSVTSGQLSAMLQREDGTEWLRLIAANNAAASVATYCQVGSVAVHRVDGGTYCELPLWLQHDGVVSPVPGRIADSNAVLGALSGWLISWGPWWLLSAGALAFLVFRMWFGWVADIPVLRKLLALPPHP